MKIAEIAPCWFSVPPTGYGGIEFMVSVLTDGLVARGHDVTLFAAGDSRTAARLQSFYPTALGRAAIEQPLLELPHLVSAYAQADEYDIVHDHTTFGIGPSLAAHLKRAVVVHTLHVPVYDSPYLQRVYQMINSRVHFVAVSDAQRQNCPALTYAATIHHGIPLDRFHCSPKKEDYLLFVGRMCREKGPHLAIKAAQAVGRRLLMGVKMHEPDEREFFEAEVRSLLTPNIEILGELTFEQKLGVFANAACTLMPVEWPEPFGLVAIESMACGTPVVALRRGALSEIVEDGVNGVLAENMEEFVAGIERAASIDPAACRRSAAARFSVDTMLDRYEQLFERVKSGM